MMQEAAVDPPEPAPSLSAATSSGFSRHSRHSWPRFCTQSSMVVVGYYSRAHRSGALHMHAWKLSLLGTLVKLQAGTPQLCCKLTSSSRFSSADHQSPANGHADRAMRIHTRSVSARQASSPPAAASALQPTCAPAPPGCGTPPLAATAAVCCYLKCLYECARTERAVAVHLHWQ